MHLQTLEERLSHIGLQLGMLSRSDGSAFFSIEDTSVIANVQGPIEARMSSQKPDVAIIDLNLLPSHTVAPSSKLEINVGGMENIIFKFIEKMIMRELYPHSAIVITIQVALQILLFSWLYLEFDSEFGFDNIWTWVVADEFNWRSQDFMPATILNGTNIASEVTEKLKTEIQSIKQEHPAFQPHLAILQVGNRIESNLYVKIKQKTCERIGLTTDYFKFPADVTQDVVMSKILELNDDAHVHGILLQLPLDCLHPIDADTCIQAISRSKDVDGLHPFNSGLLARGNLRDGFIPCTAKACLTIIEKTGIDLRGKQAVVIGRSKLVGSPMADLLKWRDATVTTCHSKTKNLPSIVEQADVLVVAVGHANLVKGEWLKPGAIVVDCGINYEDDPSSQNAYRLIGDVEFSSCSEKASFITPVPGGVGPMTVATLLANTFDSAKGQLQRSVSFSTN